MHVFFLDSKDQPWSSVTASGSMAESDPARTSSRSESSASLVPLTAPFEANSTTQGSNASEVARLLASARKAQANGQSNVEQLCTSLSSASRGARALSQSVSPSAVAMVLMQESSNGEVDTVSWLLDLAMAENITMGEVPSAALAYLHLALKKSCRDRDAAASVDQGRILPSISFERRLICCACNLARGRVC